MLKLNLYRLLPEAQERLLKCDEEIREWMKVTQDLSEWCSGSRTRAHTVSAGGISKVVGFDFYAPRNKAFWKKVKGTQRGWRPIKRPSPKEHLEFYEKFEALECDAIFRFYKNVLKIDQARIQVDGEELIGFGVAWIRDFPDGSVYLAMWPGASIPSGAQPVEAIPHVDEDSSSSQSMQEYR